MKRFWKISVVCLLAGFILYPVLDAAAAEKTMTVRFSLQFPPKHHLVRAAMLFAKTVGDRSKGSIKVQVYPAGQIYDEKAIIEAVATKSIEMGDILVERWGGVDRLFDIFASNLYLVDSYDLSWKVADGKDGATLAEIMKKHGCYPVFWSCSGFYKGLTNSKRPILRVKDWQGLLIRTSTGPSTEQTKLFGGSGVLMSGGEAFDAMQRKTVDGSSTTLSSVLDRKYYEVQKYLTIFADYPSYHVWMVNWKWWSELPKDKKDLLTQAALEAQKWDRQELVTIEDDYIKKLQKLMTTHMQTEAEAEEWAKASQPLADNWLKATGAEGKKLLDSMMQTKQEFKAQKKK